MSARKKWDLSVPPCTDYYSPKMNVSTNSESYSDADCKNDSGDVNKFNHLRKTLDYRSPLMEVNHNTNDVTVSASKVYSNKPERTKSCPKQFYAIKKKRSKCKLSYNLRKTPERLLRLIVSSSSNESGELINTDENSPSGVCSPLVIQPDVRILRNRSMHLTSTAKKSKYRVSFSTTTPIAKEFSPIKADLNFNSEESLFNKSKLERSNTSEVFHTPTENMNSSKHENMCSTTGDKHGKAEKSDSEVFHTPTDNLSEKNSSERESLSPDDDNKYSVIHSEVTASKTMVNEIAKLEVIPEYSEQNSGLKVPECESEEAEKKRGSYVVTDSKFNPCDLPKTPAIIRRSPRSLSSSITSDDPSLFQVNYVNRRSSKKSNKKKGKRSYNTSTVNNKSAVMRRNTVCQPFHLITDERYPKLDSTSSAKEHSFNSQLRRNNTPKISTKARRTTKVSPFNFALPNIQANRKRPRDEENEGYTPLAERVAAHFKTPTRFRSTSRLTVFKPPAKKESPEFVRPKTPKLQAVKRRRTVNFLSHEQQLELEAIQMRKYRFKAKPFNPKIINPPAVIKERKPPTIPEEFHLETEKRILTRKYSDKTEIEEPKFEFKARKVPKSVLQGPVNVEKTPVPRTLPRSPRLSLNERAVKWKNFCPADASPEVFVFKAKPAPALKSPRNLKPLSNKTTTTTVQPFTFDQKDKLRFANKEKKIQEELEEKCKPFRFQATEIPAFVSTPKLSASQVERKPPTIPQPFNLHPGNYSSRKRSLLNSSDYVVPKVPSATKFKAKPATVLKKKPFIPRKSFLPVVECLKFDLQTEKRAKEWARLSEEKKSLEMEKEEAMKKFMKEQEEREREEIRQLRQDLVHKAQPVRKYRVLEIKPSDKPATTPCSPPFATKRRLMQKLSTT